MNLIERYIQAVKIELSPRQREDIGRELQSSIQEGLDDLAERNRQAPTEHEVSQYLERLGHPVRVASTYWTRRSLISEAAYPIYKQALILGLSWYIGIGVLLAVLDLEGTQGWAITQFPRVLNDIVAVVLFGLFSITLVFHYFGDAIAALPFFWRWNPKRLPNLENLAAYLPRTQTAWALIGSVFSLSLLTFGSLGYRSSDLTIDLSSGSAALVALRILVLVDFGLNLLHLIQPHWTRAKLMVHVLNQIAIVFCLVQIFLLPNFLVVSSLPALDPNLLSSINLMIKISLAFMVLMLIWTEWRRVRGLLPIKLPWF